ncbi:MAG: hypothetical protein QOH30_1113 [Baekduia sp.]|nr:hypothetical protein [Baekduia sp.]
MKWIAGALTVSIILAVLAGPGLLRGVDAVAALELLPDDPASSALKQPLWTDVPAGARSVAAGGPRAQVALSIVRDAQRHGVLAAVVGPRPLRVVQLGDLQDHGRTIGVTALLTLPVARHGVHATVPGAPPVRFVAPVLRDVLVDVDLQRHAIVAVQPGPASRTSTWAPAAAPQPAAATATAVARTALAPVRLSPHGPSFAPFDGTPTLGPITPDWPVSLVFTGHATVGKVKAALRSAGFTHAGEERWLAYGGAGGSRRLDGDRGLKTACDANGTDVHLRLYAPSKADHFTDPRFGSVVVATAHLDRGEACTTPPRLFGFSEEAERRVADVAAHQLHWRVRRDAVPLHNAQPYRRDLAAPEHLWWSDGRATLIAVP